jgi:UDP-N-acetyl-D-glucosamine dehydrogenase
MTVLKEKRTRRQPAPERLVEPILTGDLVPIMVGRAPTVAILGLGYVGLPTALAILDAGMDVIGIDVSMKRLAAIRSRRVDLSPLDHARLGKALRSRGLRLSTRSMDLAGADAVIIAVPTPVDQHLIPDLSLLKAACASVVASAGVGQTIILTSTSYVGCTRDLLIRPLEERGLVVGNDIFVAFSPERIDPGNTAFPPERVPRVVGGATAECLRRAVDVVGAVAPSTHQVSSPEVAEMTKLHENIFRAVNIALVNEMADVARRMHIDVTEVIQAASTKPYGFMPFSPGPGVGGHCIPCDPYYLLWQLRRERVEAPVIEQAMAAIARRPGQVVSRAAEVLAELHLTLRGARVIVVGVAYKPDVEDVRESPALEILHGLIEAGAEVAFADRLVECIHVDGHELCAEREPATGQWDLAIVHTFDPEVNLDWLERVPAVLDASFRVKSLPVATL